MKRRKLKSWVVYSLITIVLTIVLVGLIQKVNADEERHIERVSKECSEQGYGIIATYGNDGEKYYVCNK